MTEKPTPFSQSWLNRDWVKLPPYKASVSILNRLCGQMCRNYGTMRGEAFMNDLVRKFSGPSTYFTAVWSTKAVKKMPSWEPWVRTCVLDAHPDVDPESAASVVLSNTRIFEEMINLWNIQRGMMSRYSVDIGDRPQFYVVPANGFGREFKCQPFPWYEHIESICPYTEERLTTEYDWPDAQMRRVMHCVVKWEFMRGRDGGVSTICPLFPMAIMMSLGLAMTPDEIFVPLGDYRP